VPRLPVVSGDDATAAFRKAGWVVRRQIGSHVIMEKEGMEPTLSVPRHRELDRGLLRGLIRDAGLTVAEFARLLKR
jgi:predicted RNA binding protein YcfA (HicA-like mRNA interferase family)